MNNEQFEKLIEYIDDKANGEETNLEDLRQLLVPDATYECTKYDNDCPHIGSAGICILDNVCHLKRFLHE